MFGIEDAIAAGSKLIDDIVTRVWPDATEVEKAKIAQATAEIQNGYNTILAQIKVNEAEANNPHLFVAGWRPFIGWVGGFGLGYQLLFSPIANGVAAAFGLPATIFPGIDTSLLQTLIGGMLGLGVARSYEKVNGVETKNFGKNARG